MRDGIYAGTVRVVLFGVTTEHTYHPITHFCARTVFQKDNFPVF